MGEWKKSSCGLCAISCGLEVYVEDNKISGVRGDKDNPKSEGYLCRKGRSNKYFQHNSERIYYPLKKVGDKFERISWEQAMKEIGERMHAVTDTYGTRALAMQGLGPFFGTIHGAMANTFMELVGTQFYFNALAAELTGLYWSCGVMLGDDDFFLKPDEEECDVLCVCGANPNTSHQMHQAKRVLRDISTDPNKKLIVIDPRRSETARMADIYLPIKAGTDALLWKAMIALLLQEGLENKAYIKEHVSNLEKVLPWFEDVDVKAYCKMCELDYEKVKEVTRILATSKSAFHSELGIICGRHTTLTTHLQLIFFTLCGRLLTPGGMYFTPNMNETGPYTTIDDPSSWRTTETNYPKIHQMFPTAVLAKEIDNDNEDRIRALIACHSNPMRSNVNTNAHKAALEKLDLLVTIDCVMTETAAMSDYILPDATGFETYESNLIVHVPVITFPKISQHLRQPIIKAEGEVKDPTWVWLQLIKAYGLMPVLPDYLYKAAKKSRMAFIMALFMRYFVKNPQYKPLALPIIAETLGEALGSASLASYWAMLNASTEAFKQRAKEVGYKVTLKQKMKMIQSLKEKDIKYRVGLMPDSQLQMEMIFQDALKNPQGIVVGIVGRDSEWDMLKTPDKKINLYAKELDEWIEEITPEKEEKLLNNKAFPFVFNSGRHHESVINQTMRDPAWIMGKRNKHSAHMHPDDARALGIEDNELVRIVTRVGEVIIPMHISIDTAKGNVWAPHGQGFVRNGKADLGVNLNILTDDEGLDRIAGTPIHRHLPCRIEKLQTLEKITNQAKGNEDVLSCEESIEIDSSILLQHLHAHQEKKGYLSQDDIKEIANRLSLSEAKVFETASFYAFFYFKPQVKHKIQLCESAPCHIAGAKEIVDYLEKTLEIQIGDTSYDGIELEYIQCIGQCHTAPNLIVDGKLYTHLTVEKVKEMINTLKEV